jgi:hypothetical protein
MNHHPHRSTIHHDDTNPTEQEGSTGENASMAVAIPTEEGCSWGRIAGITSENSGRCAYRLPPVYVVGNSVSTLPFCRRSANVGAAAARQRCRYGMPCSCFSVASNVYARRVYEMQLSTLRPKNQEPITHTHPVSRAENQEGYIDESLRNYNVLSQS